MFDKIASKFQSFVLVALVTLLSAVFVLQFGGPQADGCSAGGAASSIEVYDTAFSEGDFRAAMTLASPQRMPAERARALGMREAVADGMVETALLARHGREMGFDVQEEEVWERMDTEGTILLTLGVDSQVSGGEIPVQFENEEGAFDPEQAKRFIQNYLRRSVSEFADWQTTELLAQRAREVILSTVQVSPREVWDTFVRERDRAQIKYARFSPAFYRDNLDASEENIRAWMADNGEALDREYQSNRHRYTGLEEQVRARHILIKAGASATEEVRGAARSRAQSLLDRVRAGEDFAALAGEHSEDPGSARRGGDLGYNPRGRMVGPFDEAQFELEVGTVSDLVETSFGFHIIKSEGRREGDVPEDEAKRELAERLYRESEAETLARAAATEALAALRGGLSWDDLDDRLAGRTPAVEAVEGEPAAEGEEAPIIEDDEEEDERDPLAPRVTESREFGRTDTPIPGPFDASPLVRAVFEMTMDSPLPDEPIQLGQEFVVFRLESRSEAERDDFDDEVRERITRGLEAAKRREVLKLAIDELRAEAEADGAIRVDPAILRYDTEEDADDDDDDEEADS